jgi:hypothetical protein
VKFERYLKENKSQEYLRNFIRTVSRDCGQIIREMRTNVLFRGIFDHGFILERIPRGDREPLDTPKEIQEKMDAAFKKKFGWKVRSEGVFCTIDLDTAYGYGFTPYVIFPTDGYKFVYSKRVQDLSMKIEEFLETKTFDQIADLYTDKNLIEVPDSHEISIKCKKYHAISMTSLFNLTRRSDLDVDTSSYKMFMSSLERILHYAF